MFRTILQPSKRIPCRPLAPLLYLRPISGSLPVLATKTTKDQKSKPKRMRTEKKPPEPGKVFRNAPKLDLTQRQVHCSLTKPRLIQTRKETVGRSLLQKFRGSRSQIRLEWPLRPQSMSELQTWSQKGTRRRHGMKMVVRSLTQSNLSCWWTPKHRALTSTPSPTETL